MIVQLTRTEQHKSEAIETKYAQLIADCDAEIERLRPGDQGPDEEAYEQAQALRLPQPQPPAPIAYDKDESPVYDAEAYREYQESPAYKAYEEARDAANEAVARIFDEWEAAGSEEWRAARKRRLELMEELNQARRQFYRQCEQRQFSKLQGDPDKIKADAKSQIEQMIESRYEYCKQQQAKGDVFSARYLRVDGDSIYLDPQQIIEDSKELLSLHYAFFADDPKATQEINTIVLDAIARCPYASKKGKLFGFVNSNIDNNSNIGKHDKHGNSDNILVRAATAWITPVDKLSNRLYDGSISTGKKIGIDVASKRTKKQLLTMVSLDFTDGAIKIMGKRELTAYDREVHDALVTLYVDGENEYITPQMIYRAMTGDNNARLTPKQQESISNSLNKLMYSRLIIDASAEAKAYGFDSFKYEGAVIQGEKVTATISGNVLEVIHILRQPALYSYASKKNQIGRLDIKLLDSPVNKNEENIILQSYLYRRILAMKGSSLSPTIVYDTVYKQIDISASSDSALRKKKHKVRETVKNILNYWKQQGFIKGYAENLHGQECYSVTMRL